MATISGAEKRVRVFLGMGGPPLEFVAYSSRPFVPFQLRQNNRMPAFKRNTDWHTDRLRERTNIIKQLARLEGIASASIDTDVDPDKLPDTFLDPNGNFDDDDDDLDRFARGLSEDFVVPLDPTDEPTVEELRRWERRFAKHFCPVENPSPAWEDQGGRSCEP